MKLTELLSIEFPIIQGAMAQIAMAPLAAAVSKAGGLGIIASGGMTPDQLRDEIKQVRQLTDRPFGVNLMLMMEGVEALVQVVIEEKVPVVTTGAGTPKRFMPQFKEAGIKVIPVIPNVKIAMKMEAIGCDAVIAEGSEAGGHIGSVSTMVLVPQVVRSVSIPVIAAGGVANGSTMAAAFALGAIGVQCGTVFLATKECPIPDSYKQKVVEASETSTVITGASQNHPVRVLGNEMTQQYLEMEKAGASAEELEAITAGSLYRAAKLGDVVTGSMMCGQSGGLVDEIKTVETVINELYENAKEIAKTLTI